MEERVPVAKILKIYHIFKAIIFERKTTAVKNRSTRFF